MTEILQSLFAAMSGAIIFLLTQKEVVTVKIIFIYLVIGLLGGYYLGNTFCYYLSLGHASCDGIRLLIGSSTKSIVETFSAIINFFRNNVASIIELYIKNKEK
jgi:hypothetical protein